MMAGDDAGLWPHPSSKRLWVVMMMMMMMVSSLSVLTVRAEFNCSLILERYRNKNLHASESNTTLNTTIEDPFDLDPKACSNRKYYEPISFSEMFVNLTNHSLTRLKLPALFRVLSNVTNKLRPSVADPEKCRYDHPMEKPWSLSLEVGKVMEMTNADNVTQNITKILLCVRVNKTDYEIVKNGSCNCTQEEQEYDDASDQIVFIIMESDFLVYSLNDSTPHYVFLFDVKNDPSEKLPFLHLPEEREATRTWTYSGLTEIIRLRKHSQLIIKPSKIIDRTIKNVANGTLNYVFPPCFLQVPTINLSLNAVSIEDYGYFVKFALEKIGLKYTLISKLEGHNLSYVLNITEYNGQVDNGTNRTYYNCWGTDIWARVTNISCFKDDQIGQLDGYFLLSPFMWSCVECQIIIVVIVIMVLVGQTRYYKLMCRLQAEEEMRQQEQERKRMPKLPYQMTPGPIFLTEAQIEDVQREVALLEEFCIQKESGMEDD